MPVTLPVQTEYHAYGASAVPFKWLLGRATPPEECLIEGPAGTGKSVGIGKFLWALLDHYPDACVLVVRKTLTSLRDSFQDTFESEVLWPEHPSVLGRQREYRTKYVHPNGAELRLGGFDKPRSLFSTQYTVVFVNEMTELLKKEWESLHRALRRPGGPGWHLLLGDCNPDLGEHWANRRFPKGHGALRDGKLRLLSKHEDNPTITKAYLRRLDRQLTGPNRDRLFLGIWRSAEGMVYPMWDASVHLITGELEWPTDAYGEVLRGETVKLHIQRGVVDDDIETRELRWFGASMDFGWTSPGSFSVYGFDGDKRAYQVREVYYTRKELDWWAACIFEAWRTFRFRFVVCDSADPRSIKHLNDWCQKRGMPRICVPIDKPKLKRHGFDHVRQGLRVKEDGNPSIYFLRDTLWAPRGEPERDPNVDQDEKPCGTAEEIPYLVLAEQRETEKGEIPQEESDQGCPDHGCDGLMYLWLHAWRKDLSKKKNRPKYAEHLAAPFREDAQMLAKKERRMRRRL